MKSANWIWIAPTVGVLGLLGCAGNTFEHFVRDRAAQGTIAASDPFDGGTYYDAFLIEALADGNGIVNMEGQDCFSCENDSDNIDTELFVKRLNGDSVAEDDDSGGGSDARVVFPVQAGQQFRVVATTAPSRQTGRYRLTVSENIRIVRSLPN